MTILRSIIDKTVGVIGAIRTSRKVTPDTMIADGRVCVNLGCGLAVAPGWINVDASLNALFGGAPEVLLSVLYRASGANRYYSHDEYCSLVKNHRFIFHDLARSLPFQDHSVDVFYSSHFLEHLFPKDASRLLRNTRLALKPGGVIRIAVPDLAHAVALYGAGQKQRMLDDYFFVDDLSSYLARHKYMYDYELLESALRSAGFEDIRRCAFREGRTPDLERLDNRPDETLFVEATR